MASSGNAVSIDRNALYLIAYVLSLVTGIIVLLIAGENPRLKKHAIQAIILGIVSIVVSVVLFFVPFLPSILDLLIWVYGLYIGFEAYSGKDINIPWITGFADRHSG